MSESRRHSTRNRGEPPMKLRRTSPEPTKPEAASPPTTGRKPGRPRKSESKHSPSIPPRPNPRTKAKASPMSATPTPEAQDVQTERVEDMATLIEQSRQRWLTDGGIFEKFWTRPPRKRKGMPAPDLPTKVQMNMVELGVARLVIEPHVFDITVWGVKKPALAWQPPLEAPAVNGKQPAPSTPGTASTATPAPQKPIPQNPYVHPSPAATPSQQPPNTQSSNQRGLAPNPYAMPDAPIQPPNVPSAQGQKPTFSVSQQTARPTPQVTAAIPGSLSGHTPSAATALPRPQQQAQPAPQHAPAPQTSAPHPDPVIQMLAQRAAGDPNLKELMKVVAAGSEDPGKLAEFQRHINEITEIVNQSRAKAQRPGGPLGGPALTVPRQQTPTSKPQQRPAAFIQSKPPAVVRYDFHKLAFDFARQGDCYLFPRSSIIQHMADRTATLVSFIFTRKGKDIPTQQGSSRLKPEVEYYQPITVSILTTEPRIRDALNQSVGEKGQVAKEMNEIMERCTLAPDCATMFEAASIAAKGVKRDSGGAEKDSETKEAKPKAEANADDAASGVIEDDILRAEWDAPDSLLPLAKR